MYNLNSLVDTQIKHSLTHMRAHTTFPWIHILNKYQIQTESK